MGSAIDALFRQRLWREETNCPGDTRDPYQRDRARITHSATFRRIQGKTQVMGVGGGGFHRTRLTHSLEAARIGEEILRNLVRVARGNRELMAWLPTSDLIVAACYAHDLGHPLTATAAKSRYTSE